MTPVTMTKNAADHMLNLLGDAPDGTQGLRLNIKSTGCSGHSYSMEYIKPDESLDGDDVFQSEGATLYIPKMHSWMLFGMVVDYIVDDLGNARFDFSNPNESGRCGCGESFHVNVDELQKLSDAEERVSE